MRPVDPIRWHFLSEAFPGTPEEITGIVLARPITARYLFAKVSSPMNSHLSQFDCLEADLQVLSKRIPNVPLTGILLCRLIMHLGREMTAMLEYEIRPFGLAEAEFRVLTALFSQSEGAAHPSELCMWTSQSPANMSRISDNLVSRELITRVLSVRDRRRIVMRITDQGENLVNQLLPKIFMPIRDMLTEFPHSEQYEIISQLKRVALQIQAKAPQPLGSAPRDTG